MSWRFCVLFVGIAVSLCTAPSAAQTLSTAQITQGDVTFNVPLNLTQLSYDVSKVAVTCTLMKDSWSANDPEPSSAFKQADITVTGGQLVSTATVTVSAGFRPGTNLNYQCELKAFSTSLQRWSGFSARATELAFRLTPDPQRIIGRITW